MEGVGPCWRVNGAAEGPETASRLEGLRDLIVLPRVDQTLSPNIILFPAYFRSFYTVRGPKTTMTRVRPQGLRWFLWDPVHLRGLRS